MRGLCSVPELAPVIEGRSNVRVFEKTLFSMITPEVKAHIEAVPIKTAVLFGIEVRCGWLPGFLPVRRPLSHAHLLAPP